MSSETPAQATLEDWIEANGGVATIVFTDVVKATVLLYGTDSMEYMRTIRAHRRRAKELVESLDGRVIDMSGDAVFAAFLTVANAFRFAGSIAEDPGHESVLIRAGIHRGAVHARGDEGLFGKAVHFAARLQEQGAASEVLASEAAKLELEAESPEFARSIRWSRRDGCELEGIPGKHTVWRAG